MKLKTPDGEYAQCSMPKTGSVGLTVYAESIRAGSRKGRPSQHIPVEESIEAYEGRKLVGTVRGPWEWYLSYWKHGISHSVHSRYDIRRIGRGSLEFDSFIHGAMNIDPAMSYGLFRHRPAGKFPQPGESLYSFAMRYFYGYGDDNEIDVYINCGRLEDACSELFGKDHDLGMVNTSSKRDESAATHRYGSIVMDSSSSVYRYLTSIEEAYSSHTAVMVGEKERQICDNLNWSFGETPDWTLKRNR